MKTKYGPIYQNNYGHINQTWLPVVFKLFTRNSGEALNSSINDYWQVIPTYVYLVMKFREDPYRIHNGIGIVDCLASGEGLGIWLLPWAHAELRPSLSLSNRPGTIGSLS